MSLWRKLKGELIDIIEWLDESPTVMVYRFERYNNEIKYGAKLIVRPGQNVVFVNEGQVADVFPPGTYTLETRNLPILSTLMGWKHGFESPFKAEAIFVKTTRFPKLLWGTPEPIMKSDPKFGTVEITARGSYEIRVSDPKLFIEDLVGTDGRFTTDEVQQRLRDIAIMQISNAIAALPMPADEISAQRNELGALLIKNLTPEFGKNGLEITAFNITAVNLPDEYKDFIRTKAKAENMNLQAYAQLKAADAMADAAKNPGGIAAAGVGIGMGFHMAGQLGQALQPAHPVQNITPAMPPPVPQPIPFFVAVNGQQAGPFDAQTLRQHIQNGQINRETLVWKQGMSQWTAAGQVAELAGVFDVQPPPLPGMPPPLPS